MTALDPIVGIRMLKLQIPMQYPMPEPAHALFVGIVMHIAQIIVHIVMLVAKAIMPPIMAIVL